jgi:hypothetical protein
MRVFAHLDQALPTFLRVRFLWDARYAGFMSQRAYMVLMSKDLDSFREGGVFRIDMRPCFLGRKGPAFAIFVVSRLLWFLEGQGEDFPPKLSC